MKKKNKFHQFLVGLSIAIITAHGIVELNRWSEQFAYAMIGITMYSYVAVVTLITVVFILSVWNISTKIEHYVATKRDNIDLANALIKNIDEYLLQQKERMEINGN